ncbi:hypothetical protein BKA62DRAFT_269387 [Auriculariales sp. MPI-PUGE-AT-0066]|nr:hypothetical protein BKA62DRAFT_269387 [Auriculariales sp. MPI-PUGE-AT-0066]
METKGISFLDLDDDVLHLICVALRNPPFRGDKRRYGTSPPREPTELEIFSMTSKRLRHISVPALFSAIRISCFWSKATSVLTELAQQSHLIKHTREISFVTDVDHKSWERETGSVAVSDETITEVVSQLCGVLAMLAANLKRISVDFDSTEICSWNNSAALGHLRGIFTQATRTNPRVLLPNVTELNTDSVSWEGFISLCPNVADQKILLEQSSRSDTVLNEGSSHPALQSLTVLGSDELSFQKISAAVAASIVDLRIDLGSNPKRWMDFLKPFKKVQTLRFPDVANLDLGFSHPECWTDVYNMSDDEYEEHLAYQEDSKHLAITRATQIVGDALPHVRTLVVEDVTVDMKLWETSGHVAITTDTGVKLYSAADIAPKPEPNNYTSGNASNSAYVAPSSAYIDDEDDESDRDMGF